MKKTKLLTSLAALALVVSLGACQESSKDEDKETSPSDVLDIVRERGAAISSWNGVDASGYTVVSIYPEGAGYDLGSLLGLENDLTLGSYASYNSARGVNTETGLEGLYDYVYYDIDNSSAREEGLYFDGLDCYAYNNGEIIYNKDGAKDYDISFFAANLFNLLENEDEDGMLAILSQYVKLGDSNSAYTVEGLIEQGSDGTLSVGFYVVCNGDSGVSTLGHNYDASGHITLEIDYDANGDISQFYYEAGEIVSYANAQGIAAATQVFNFAPYDGEVDAPDWLDNYEASGNTDSE